MRETSINVLLIILFIAGCNKRDTTTSFSTVSVAPTEILDFTAYEKNPVFTGADNLSWDKTIRERGYILKEGDEYRMWYTGFRDESETQLSLGYATSPDGLTWTRHPGNPVYDSLWVEDMMVIKHSNLYYMFAEGRDDIAHMLTSADGIQWKSHGSLDIRYTNGDPLSPGPYGTPTVWTEGDTWYLFYERGDLGIWLATSTDRKVWTNIQDDPVLTPGPEKYDQYGVAVNQIVLYNDKYYAYYHATEFEDWSEWTSCVAISDDLVHWKKYENNPIMRENKSSPILVHDGSQYRLYTMHPEVSVHFPTTK